MIAILWRHAALLVLLLTVPFARTQQISELFTLDATCNGNIDDLNTVLIDARTMLTNAINAANGLQTTKSFTGTPGSTDRNLMRNARHTFGTTFYSKTTIRGLSADDKATMATVASTLTAVKNLLQGSAVPRPPANDPEKRIQLGPSRAYIACSDNSYQPATFANQIDANQNPTATVSEKYLIRTGYALYVPNNPFIVNGVNRLALRPEAELPANAARRVCQPGVVAETTSRDFYQDSVSGFTEPLVQVVLCPLFFNAPYRATISGVTPPSSARVADYQFRASVLIHEMLHIFGDIYSDTKYYDKDGPNTNVLRSPYGPANIYALATQQDKFIPKGGSLLSTTLPDAYRTFVDMCNWPSTVWSSGVVGEDMKKRAIVQAFGEVESLLVEQNATETIERLTKKWALTSESV